MLNQETENHSVSDKKYLVPFILITSLFFLWGFARAILDVLNKHFQNALHISITQSAMIQVTTYLGYFLMAIPAGDNKWDAEAMEQSFLMTNICPQDHVLNIGDWNNLEAQCRQWAEQYGSIYVVCGPVLYNKRHKTIGKNKVVVPEAFFKVILRMGCTPQAIGFVYRNNDKRHPWGDYVNSVDEVERITGFDFFASLPDSVERQVERQVNVDMWPIQALH